MKTLDEVLISKSWEEAGWPAPVPDSVEHARKVLASLSESEIPGLLPPFISSDYDGCITMEFWNDPKKTTLFIYAAPRIDFLKSWGPNMDTEMEDGETDDPSPVLRWLYEKAEVKS